MKSFGESASGAAVIAADPAGQSGPRAAIDYRPDSVLGDLFREPGAFDFFQAVLLLEQMQSADHYPVGRAALPTQEGLRFRAALGTAFPTCGITEILPPAADSPVEMTVALFGLTGPSGILPRHYTELLYRLEREAKGPQRHALRDWFDLFNHRLISLYHRSWEKYRFHVAALRGMHAGPTADTFTTSVFSLCGLGFPSMRNQLRLEAEVGERLSPRRETLAAVNDLSLLRYGGLLSQRPRTASNLEQIIRDYFCLPVRVDQFQGQWLTLDEPQQSTLSALAGNNALGVSAVVGERVWDIQSRIRIRLGPLRGEQFVELLPDESPAPEQKSFFLLCQLVRLFVGPELEFEVQLELEADAVPECQLTDDAQRGPRLGWNSWLLIDPAPAAADDARFESIETTTIDTRPSS